MSSGLQVLDSTELGHHAGLSAEPAYCTTHLRHRHDVNSRFGVPIASWENLRNWSHLHRPRNHEQHTRQRRRHHGKGRCLVTRCHHVHLDIRWNAWEQLWVDRIWPTKTIRAACLPRACQLRRGMSQSRSIGTPIDARPRATHLYLEPQTRSPQGENVGLWGRRWRIYQLLQTADFLRNGWDYPQAMFFQCN